MRYSSTRMRKNETYERFNISTKRENNEYVAAFYYVDSLIGYEYSSQVFIQANEWAAVKIAVIHAEKYMRDNNIKDCMYFIQDIWQQFLSQRNASSKGCNNE